MGSISVPNMDAVDHILKGLVEGDKRALHNACYLVMGKEGQ